MAAVASMEEEKRNERIVRGLLELPPNRRCINCNDIGPQYVCTSFWTFICISCSGIHREFTHRVKSVSMSKFTTEEVEALQKGGNQRAKESFLKDFDAQQMRLPHSRNIASLTEFIRVVYVERRYAGVKVSESPPRDKQNPKIQEEECTRASSYLSYYNQNSHTYVLPPSSMPHINDIGSPPILDATNYCFWKFSMKGHINAACVELWEVVKRGYKPEDRSNLTPQERVDQQLNATAVHMIKEGLSPLMYDHVLLIKSANELWEHISIMHENASSIQWSMYEMSKNAMSLFYLKEGESPRDCFMRLNALRVKIQVFGCILGDKMEMDDEFIKCKFLQALAYQYSNMVFSIFQKDNFDKLSPDDVLALFFTHENMVKSSREALAINRDSKRPNLALKVKQIQESQGEEDDDEEEPQSISSDFYNDLALLVKKYRGLFIKREIKLNKDKKRTCYNRGEENHFASDCPYEKREDKPEFKKKEARSDKKLPNPLNKGKTFKKEDKAFVGTTYMSNDFEDEEDDVVGVAGLAKLAKPNTLLLQGLQGQRSRVPHGQRRNGT